MEQRPGGTGPNEVVRIEGPGLEGHVGGGEVDRCGMGGNGGGGGLQGEGQAQRLTRRVKVAPNTTRDGY